MKLSEILKRTVSDNRMNKQQIGAAVGCERTGGRWVDTGNGDENFDRIRQLVRDADPQTRMEILAELAMDTDVKISRRDSQDEDSLDINGDGVIDAEDLRRAEALLRGEVQDTSMHVVVSLGDQRLSDDEHHVLLSGAVSIESMLKNVRLIAERVRDCRKKARPLSRAA